MSSRAVDDPVLEERRRAALAQVRQYGDPVLRTPALEITRFDDALRHDIRRMAALMEDAHGVGLAAPQIGSLRRLIVMRAPDEGAVVALCNPRIVWSSDETETDVEGCLSIGDVTVEVPRAVAIQVQAEDPSGETRELRSEGFAARVLQHEIDHLNGILILDRTSPEQRREALRALRDGV